MMVSKCREKFFRILLRFAPPQNPKPMFGGARMRGLLMFLSIIFMLVVSLHCTLLSTCPARKYMSQGCLTAWIKIPPGLRVCFNWQVFRAKVHQIITVEIIAAITIIETIIIMTLKYGVESGRVQSCLKGRRGSLALVGSPLRYSVLIKKTGGSATQNSLTCMSEISKTNVSNNVVNEAGVYIEGLSPGMCPVVRTRKAGCHQTTVGKTWLTQDNICVITCYYKRQPDVRECRQRSHAF